MEFFMEKFSAFSSQSGIKVIDVLSIIQFLSITHEICKSLKNRYRTRDVFNYM